jgi:hypothetical protein
MCFKSIFIAESHQNGYLYRLKQGEYIFFFKVFFLKDPNVTFVYLPLIAILSFDATVVSKKNVIFFTKFYSFCDVVTLLFTTELYVANEFLPFK